MPIVMDDDVFRRDEQISLVDEGAARIENARAPSSRNCACWQPEAKGQKPLRT